MTVRPTWLNKGSCWLSYFRPVTNKLIHFLNIVLNFGFILNSGPASLLLPGILQTALQEQAVAYGKKQFDTCDGDKHVAQCSKE